KHRKFVACSLDTYIRETPPSEYRAIVPVHGSMLGRRQAFHQSAPTPWWPPAVTLQGYDCETINTQDSALCSESVVIEPRSRHMSTEAARDEHAKGRRPRRPVWRA